ATGAHAVVPGLVTVAQTHSTRAWGAVDDLIRPGAVRQGDVVDFLEEGQVAAVRHLGVALLVPGRLVGRDFPVGGLDLGWCGDEGVGVAHVFFPKVCWCRAVAMKNRPACKNPATGSRSVLVCLPTRPRRG